MQIKKNDLTFTVNPNNEITCDDLRTVAAKFEEQYTAEQVTALIDNHLKLFRDMAEARYPSKEERESQTETARKELGQQRFDATLATLRPTIASKTSFEQFLFWFSSWWYYLPAFDQDETGVRFTDWNKHQESLKQIMSAHLVPVLPKAVQSVVSQMTLITVACEHNHFAILFCNKNGTRRIITDTQLFELHGVSGYGYLNITPDGKPITRSCCDRGGERAFFDGLRLMSHDQFQTCAPKTVMIKGGYKFNSTNCTVVNGFLFNLIDVDDKVAQTTGAFLGLTDFSHADHVKAVALAEQSGAQMSVSDGRVFLSGQELKPRGVFTPSCTTLLDNGFTLVSWADFHEIDNIQYRTVLVIDDSEQWISSVQDAFGSQIEKLDCFQTNNRTRALKKILETQPEAVLLDIHLTKGELFEGLWIANQLAAANFQGQILICSSYGPDALQAMQKLIKIKTVAPGKDLAKVRLALQKKKF